jgi:hypothetical protein
MNKKIAILLIFTGSLFLTACQKDLDLFVPDQGQLNAPDTVWHSSISSTMPVAILQTNLLLEPVKDSFEISSSTATALLTTAGIQCTFSPLPCVNANGQTVTGKIQAEIFVIKKKGDMVLMNKPTTANGNILVSGGEFFIKLKKDGQELQLAPNAKIQIRYVDLPTNPLMKLFYGQEINPERFNWVPASDSFNYVNTNPQVYEMVTNHLRWINLDYFYDTAGVARSTVSVRLPSYYTNANTTAFLVFNDFRSVLRMNADVPEKRFITGKVPNGKSATIVVISKQGNDYFFSKENITTGVNVTTNGNQNISLTPVKASLADIKAYLSTL